VLKRHRESAARDFRLPTADAADPIDRDVRDVSWRRIGHGWKFHVGAEVDVRQPL
jgi:hypothetical protein